MVNGLKDLFLKVWDNETCYPKSKNQWSPENPSLGQCAVTALIINDLFGGKIVYNEKYHHYWNVFNETDEFDLTRDQFVDVVIEGYEETRREDILFSERSREVRTLERYQLLWKKLGKELLHVDYIPETMEETFKWLDRFLQDKDVFKNTPEKDVIPLSRNTLDRFIRNKWYLWWTERAKREALRTKNEFYPQEKPVIVSYFEGLGILYATEMSEIIIRSYHRYLNNKPIELEDQIESILAHYKTLNIRNHNEKE